MNTHAVKVLEYDRIKECLKQYTVSEQAKSVVEELQPSIDPRVIESWMHETTEARCIIDKNPSVPLASLENLGFISKLGKGMVLNPEDFTALRSLLECVKRIRKYMGSMSSIAPSVSTYALSMFELTDLYEEIDRCIAGGGVDDRASAELSRIRKKIIVVDERIKQKLQSIISSPAYAGILQDPIISTRNGRYVIPVKKEYRRSLEGSVLGISTSGSTLFIEPAGVARMQEELNVLRIEEENEVYRILSTLTALASGYAREISINIESMVHYDFLFAKAKYSRALDCREVKLNTDNRIVINEGRHPLIGRSAVPLEFNIGGDYRALVITGPNTGGKTVVLKTVGLMTLMVQSGLHVPVGEGSQFAVFTDILADIGDGQSIEQSLSTFSSHVRNISAIIQGASSNTLAIIDELGAGTDPGEGMGFAIAVLEEVYSSGATIVATTHFSEIKEFAENTGGFKNGCMEFDIESLKPLYRLHIGKSGESNAFVIALKLGIDRRVIERAHEITYKERKEYDFGDALNTKPSVEVKPVNSHRREPVRQKTAEQAFKVGDSVFISSMNCRGIVCEPENSKGEVVVMVMKKKLTINKKRLSIYIDGKELYPDNYDFDILFETKEDRKKK